jgi:hypothetical protein
MWKEMQAEIERLEKRIDFVGNNIKYLVNKMADSKIEKSDGFRPLTIPYYMVKEISQYLEETIASLSEVSPVILSMAGVKVPFKDIKRALVKQLEFALRLMHRHPDSPRIGRALILLQDVRA